MKTNEVRVGNLLQDMKSGTIVLVSEITENTIAVEVIDRSKYPLPIGWKCGEIKLTEEWLLRFGFEKAAGQYFQNFCVLQYFDSELRLTTHQDHCLSIQIKFVHQLQNLYFALTGEELTLNN